MKACEKLFIVAYINIDGIPSDTANEYTQQVSDILTPRIDDSCILTILPVRGQETRIDFFQGVKTSEDKSF